MSVYLTLRVHAQRKLCFRKQNIKLTREVAEEILATSDIDSSHVSNATTRFTILSSCGISEKRVLVTSRTFHLPRRGIHATKCVTQCDSDPQIVLSDTFWVLTEVLRLFCILFFFQDLRLFSPEDKM